jgi:hypothetical protein
MMAGTLPRLFHRGFRLSLAVFLLWHDWHRAAPFATSYRSPPCMMGTMWSACIPRP